MVSEYIYYVASIVSQKECSKNKNKTDKNKLSYISLFLTVVRVGVCEFALVLFLLN